MQFRRIFTFVGLAIGVLTACLVPTVVTADEPALTAEVVWFLNKRFSSVNFLAFVDNRSDQPRSGVQLRWDALDANGEELKSVTATLPTIGARATYPFLSGDGRGSVNEPEPPVMRAASIRLTIVDEGSPAEAGPILFQVTNVTLDKSPLPLDPIIDQGLLAYRVQGLWRAGDESLPWKCMNETVMLRDEQGKIVGAKNWRYFADSGTQAEAMYKLHVFFEKIDAIAPAANASVRVECYSV